MNLKLHKPLCIFDLETTGINISKDRIVEICILKVFPDASRESKTWYVNPEMPIPAEATAVHGISDEDVKDSPTFKELAPKIIDMIKDSDLGGFNSNRVTSYELRVTSWSCEFYLVTRILYLILFKLFLK
jgi:DNA polymerase-3 subunit epsilon